MGFDIGLGIVLLWGAIQGYRKGFAQPAIQWTGILLGILLADPIARRLEPAAAPYLKALPEKLQTAILFLGLMFVIWLTFSITCSRYLAAFRKKAFGENKPSDGDRFFGVGFGVAKAAVFVLVFVFGINQLPDAIKTSDLFDQHYQDSKIIAAANQYPIIERLARSHEAEKLKEHLAAIAEYMKADKSVAESAQSEEIDPK